MTVTQTHAAEHLELLAPELVLYDKLDVRIIQRSSGPPYLRVVSKEANDLTETITCEISSGADKARSIAYVLQAVTVQM